MPNGKKETHESYGMISFCKFSGNSQFFGSDIVQNGGMSVKISTAKKERGLSKDWYYADNSIIEINMSHNQFVDAITSGMNTEGVPCTIKALNNERVEQVDHIIDKKEMFSQEMNVTQEKFIKRIDDINKKLDGNIGKKKLAEIKQDLHVLSNHIQSNTNFVLKCFKEEMEKVVTEAKQSVSGYVDNKIRSLGIENLREELQVSIEKPKEIKNG